MGSSEFCAIVVRVFPTLQKRELLQKHPFVWFAAGTIGFSTDTDRNSVADCFAYAAGVGHFSDNRYYKGTWAVSCNHHFCMDSVVLLSR